MILGMSLGTFTLIHVLISLVAIASGIVVVYGFLNQPEVRALDGSLSGYDRVNQPHRVPFSVYLGDACDQAGNHLVGSIGHCGCHAVSPTPDLEENFRDRDMHGVVLQCLRFCGAII